MRQELPLTAQGDRRTFRRSGFTTATEAQNELNRVRALLGIPDPDDPDGQQRLGDLLEHIASTRAPVPAVEEVRRKFRSGQSLTSRLTVGELLDLWIAGRKIRRSTIKRYEGDIRVHLKPRIGHIRIDRLRVADLSEMFNAIVEQNIEITEANAMRRAAIDELKTMRGRNARAAARASVKEMPPFRRTTGPTTRLHIRATLRAALNYAITQEWITFNPAAHVELDPVSRPKALVWTDERLEKFTKTGVRPSPVMVWTPAQTGAFLDFAAHDELYALFHLVALRGLRRGEACGLRWEDVDLRAGALTVAIQLVDNDGEVQESAPKSDAGDRPVALDAETVSTLRQHRARQQKARLKWGEAWVDSGRVFTRANGSWVEPNWLSDHFDRLVRRSGLPPIRLHDLRHGAATLALAAGVDMKVVQEMLGHASYTLTSDTYASVLPEVAREAAEAAARLVPRTRGLTSGSQSLVVTDDPAAPEGSRKKKEQLKAAL
ncbi:site-specific integrase [Actinoplanes sp. NPDC089786]|uniref:tyrosine-type recombinase/integrase n=1 Tax=Actinoplanes sp. NPDC089786 TaxID=3155185 RepID=UPI00342CC475